MADNQKGGLFSREWQRLSLELARINSEPGNQDLLEFDNKIITLWSMAETTQEKRACIDLASVLSVNFQRDFLIQVLSQTLYEAKDYATASYGYMKSAQLGVGSAKNNLAYMIRRGEYDDDSIDNASTALKLLLPGAREKDPFSLVNTALVLCLLLKTDADWHIADELFEYVPEKEKDVIDWWTKLEDEPEGSLVHFFLLRHEKMEDSPFGAIKSIARRLAESVDGFPAWLSEEYAIKTIDDVIDCIDDPDFDLILDDFLEEMPYSRDSVDEMLEVLSSWDLLPVYDKLLTECVDLLTPEELSKLKMDYKAKFTLPLPDEDG